MSENQVIPEFFNTKDFSNWVGNDGVYSKDEAVKDAAMFKNEINGAINGRVTDLNSLWARVKNGTLLDADYQLIKAIRNGEKSEVILSTGRVVKWSLDTI